MRTTKALISASIALGLAACGDDGGGTPGVDAQATVMISGVAQTVSGTSTVPLEGATIEAYDKAGGAAAIATTTSAADGTYALTLTTNGAPLDGYLKGTSSGRLDTYLYPPRPLAADRTGATMLIINQQTLGLLGTFGGTDQDPAKGFVGLIVHDANDMPVAGATVTISPAGSATVIYAANNLPSSSATATDAGGTVYIVNTNVGEVTVDAMKTGTDFHEHPVTARAGVITTTLIEP